MTCYDTVCCVTASYCETHICAFCKCMCSVVSPSIQSVTSVTLKDCLPLPCKLFEFPNFPSLWRCAENYGEIRKASTLVSLMLQFIHNLQKIVSCTNSPPTSQWLIFLFCVTGQSSSLWGEHDVSVHTHTHTHTCVSVSLLVALSPLQTYFGCPETLHSILSFHSRPTQTLAAGV